MSNPLLENLTLPAFSRIRPEHVEPAIDQLLEEHRALLQSLLEQPGGHTWETLFQPLEDKDDQINRAWSPVSHLHSVADNDVLRQAYNACLPKLTDHATELGQNEDLFRASKALAENDEYSRLDISRQQIIRNALRDFRLAGIDLEQQQKDRYKELQQKLSQLQTRFEENLLDATHGWTRPVTDETQLSGLPETAIELAAQTARRQDRSGWLFTLEYPSYAPVMTYSDDREFRREMYTAYNTRASELGPNGGKWDNGPHNDGNPVVTAGTCGVTGLPGLCRIFVGEKDGRHAGGSHGLPARPGCAQQSGGAAGTGCAGGVCRR